MAGGGSGVGGWGGRGEGRGVALLFVVICMTAGRGVAEVHWMSRPGACDVSHRQHAEHGLLSFLSLLRAFLLNVIKRNQAKLVPRQGTSQI